MAQSLSVERRKTQTAAAARLMAQEYRLDTPEAVEIRYQVAGIGTRFLATVIDSLALVGALGLVWLGGAALGVGLGGLAGEPFRTLAAVLILTLSFLVIIGYYIFFETFWNGQTPGKRALDIRVIKTSGYPVGFVDTVIRNLLRWVVDFLPSFYGVGVVCMFISPRSRRVGDYVAGTIVVKEGSSVGLGELAGRVWLPGTTGAAPGLGELDPDELQWDLNALTPQELMLATEYLERAPQLSPEVRGRIGNEIAARLVERVGARQPYDGARFIERLVHLCAEKR